MTSAMFTGSVCVSKSVNDLQCSSLDKKRFMCVSDVCDGCVWVAVEGGVQRVSFC